MPDAEGLEGMFCFASQARFAASSASAHMPTCNGECTQVRGRCHIVPAPTTVVQGYPLEELPLLPKTCGAECTAGLDAKRCCAGTWKAVAIAR